MVIQHTWPLIITTLNVYLLSDMIIYFSDIWVVPVIWGLYLSINYLVTEYIGEAAYPFLEWD